MLAANIIGQEQLKNTLDNSAENGQLPHFQVFIDEYGCGGLALGLYTAGRILGVETFEKLIQHPDMHFLFPSIASSGSKQRPQEDLATWLRFCENPYGSYADWMADLDGGNKEGIIGKDAVVEIQEKIHLKSFLGKAKVVLLWGAERINATAANKLLKSLEEPPKDTYFIFVTAAANQLLPTISSRAQNHRLARIDSTTMAQALAAKGVAKEMVQRILPMAEGSWEKALKSIGQLGSENPHEALWVNGLRAAFRAKQNKGVVQELMAWAETLAQQTRPQQLDFLHYGLELIRQAMLYNFGASSLSSFYSQTGFDIKKLAPFVHSENLVAIQQLLQDKLYFISRNANGKIQYTDMAFRLTRLLHQKES